MKVKTLLLTSIFSISSSVFAADPMNADGQRGAQAYLTRHPDLEAALKQAARKQSLSAADARELSGALFDSELAQLLLRVLQTQRDSLQRGVQPVEDPHKHSETSSSSHESVNNQGQKPAESWANQKPRGFHVAGAAPNAVPAFEKEGVSCAPQIGRQWNIPEQHAPQRNLHSSTVQKAGIGGLEIALENLKTTEWEDFKTTDSNGNEIPQAREILEILKLFAAPSAEVPEDNRGSKLLYLHGKPGRGKTTAATILMHELQRRGHTCLYVSSEQIKDYSFDLSQSTASVIVIDDLNEYPSIDTLEKKLRAFILAAYDKPSVRIVLTSNRPFTDIIKLLTQWYLYRVPGNNQRIQNADQIESRFLTLCKRAGAPNGLCFDGLPMRRK